MSYVVLEQIMEGSQSIAQLIPQLRMNYELTFWLLAAHFVKAIPAGIALTK